MKWKREVTKYRTLYHSDCGRYTIEKYDGLLRGSPVWWVLSGAHEGQRKTLRVAKKLAELHARGAPALLRVRKGDR